MAGRIWILAVVCLLGACGGDSDTTATTTSASPPTSAGAAAADLGSPAPTSAPETVATTDVPTTDVPTTDAPTTTAAPAGPITTGDGLEALPTLLDDWVAAHVDASLDPLALAERTVGFPVAVPVPEAATAEAVSVDGRPGSEAGTWAWEWTYTAIAGPDPGDVDIALEDNGPGAVALRETYDPIMAALGFRYSNSTTSDPGDPGGPNSVNHVYVAERGSIDVGGVERIADPLFVWLDEDLVGFEDGVLTPGYRIDAGAELPEGEIPVALLAELLDAVPGFGDARLTSVDLDGRSRDEDSFDAEWGLRYLAVDIRWSLDADVGLGLLDTVTTAFDDPRLVAGADSFFEPGTLEPARVTETGDGWLVDVVLVGRYPGRLSFAADEGDEGELRLRMDLEPNREPLTAPG